MAISVQAPSNAAGNTYLITLPAYPVGGPPSTLTFRIEVQSSTSVLLSASPAYSFSSQGSASPQVTITAETGYSGTAALSVYDIPSAPMSCGAPSSASAGSSFSLTCSEDGSLPPGTYVMDVLVTANGLSSIPVFVTMPSSGASGPLWISTSSLPSNAAGYPFTLQASGGTRPYSWAPLVNAPYNLSLSATGILSGTPNPGSYTFEAKVTDSFGQTASQTWTGVFTPPSLIITTSTLPNATLGALYQNFLNAAYGTAPYAWQLTSGSLPAGLSLSAARTISGTPTATGNFNFTVAVTDSSVAMHSYSQTLSINVPAPADFNISTSVSPLTISPPSGSATVTLTPLNGFATSVSLSATSSPAGLNATFSLAGQAGSQFFLFNTPDAIQMTITPNSGLAPGAYTLTVTASGSGISHSQTIAITLVPQPQIQIGPPVGPQSLQVGDWTTVPVSIITTNLTSPVTVSATGLPSGVSMNTVIVQPGLSSAMPRLAATATAAPGAYSFTLVASGGGASASQTVALTIPNFVIDVHNAVALQPGTAIAHPSQCEALATTPIPSR